MQRVLEKGKLTPRALRLFTETEHPWVLNQIKVGVMLPNLSQHANTTQLPSSSDPISSSATYKKVCATDVHVAIFHIIAGAWQVLSPMHQTARLCQQASMAVSCETAKAVRPWTHFAIAADRYANRVAGTCVS